MIIYDKEKKSLVVPNSIGNFGGGDCDCSESYNEGYTEGKEAGKTEGYEEGYNNGYAQGKADGITEGYNNGYAQGKADGYTEGETAGEATGYTKGYSEGEAKGKEEGYTEGYNAGYTEGYEDGEASSESKRINTEEKLNAAVAKGGTVKLDGDITLTKPLIVTTTVTLNLNGHTISNAEDIWDDDKKYWSLISVQENGNLTMVGNGKVKAKENDVYAIDLQSKNAILTTKNGEYVGNIMCVYVYYGTANLNGGKYSIQQLNANNVEGPYGMTINLYNAHHTEGTAKASIRGGSYYKFNPDDSESPDGSLLADGYEATLTDDWYVVSKAVGANAKIYYISSDGNIVTPSSANFGTDIYITANTYEDGKGIITLSGDATSIGKGVFRSCSSLTSITIPDSVTSIDSRAFEGCSALTSINIPDGVTSIGNDAFSGCSALTSINIPDGVTSIRDSAFYNCSSLTSINIPDGVASIEECAFQDCSSLASINIPDGVASIGMGAFGDCSALTSVTIGSGVTSIGEGAFRDCSALASVTIGSGVTSIERIAFEGCSALTSVTIGRGVTSIGNYAFSNLPTTGTLYYPSGYDYENSIWVKQSAFVNWTKVELTD